MIGYILCSVLLIQLATGSPVVSQSTKDCNKCKGKEIPQDVLKEGLASTRDRMVSVRTSCY